MSAVLIKTLVLSAVFMSSFGLSYLNADKFIHPGKTPDKTPGPTEAVNPATPPEISGWIAWWEEDKAYQLPKKYPGEIKSVSPVWFMVDKNLKLSDVGKVDRKSAIYDLKQAGVLILPSLGSELSGEKISPLFNDDGAANKFIEDLTASLVELGVDGLDVDLEGILASDREKFVVFITKLSEALAAKNLTLALTIHAQSENNDWEGVLGQDVEKLAKLADEVRIMTYDKHSASTLPGAIAPITWISEVALYNSKLIPTEKIVFGIPSYGYVWTTDGNANGLQYDEFQNYIKKADYTSLEDPDSYEQIVKSENFTGWLSDHEAMIQKIKSLRALGFNRFVIWHLGGMDEAFFENDWTNSGP